MSAPAFSLGLHRNVPASHYHADPSVSNTMLSDMAKSPAHCYALHLDPDRPEREATPAMTLGTLTHCAVLEPEAFAQRYVVKPAGMRFSTKEGMAWRDAQEPGLQIVGQDDMRAAQAMARAVRRVPVLDKLLGSGVAESSLFWQDHATGLRCRARPDWLHFTSPRSAVALDVKTIDELTPESVAKSIARYGYHRQAAHYSAGIRACDIHLEEFVFAFVSSSYPYLAVAYVLDDDSRGQGVDEVGELLGRFKECQRTGIWPAFGQGYQLIGLPVWAKRSQELEVSFV
jgi:exodeoxyribonuclease VIII